MAKATADDIRPWLRIVQIPQPGGRARESCMHRSERQLEMLSDLYGRFAVDACQHDEVAIRLRQLMQRIDHVGHIEPMFAVNAAIAAVGAEWGGIYGLVNGASNDDPTASVVDLDFMEWQRTFAVHLNGAFLASKAALPHMQRAGAGSIVHIASQMGHVGAKGRPSYCAAKGALIQLAKAMALDHAEEGIRVNTLSPGAIETRRLMLRDHADMDAAIAASAAKHALGRVGQPIEMATAALFLMSDASSFMTGTDLLVDGGYAAM